MSNKLTNQIREAIVAKAISKSGINDRQEALRLRRAAWAENVRVAALGGMEVVEEMTRTLSKIENLVAKLPKCVQSGSYVRYDNEIYNLNVAGLRVRAQFNGAESERNGFARASKITPNSYTLLADDPLTAEFHAIHEEQQALDKQRCDLTTNVSAAVQSVTTIKKLLEVWPEAAELIPEAVAPAKQLPALQREDLNAMIGLPSA